MAVKGQWVSGLIRAVLSRATLFSLTVGVLAAGCALNPSSDSIEIATPKLIRISAEAPATPVATVTPTFTPTATATSLPISLPAPVDTPDPIKTPTPVVNVAPSSAPTPSATPVPFATPTPTATPIPSATPTATLTANVAPQFEVIEFDRKTVLSDIDLSTSVKPEEEFETRVRGKDDDGNMSYIVLEEEDGTVLEREDCGPRRGSQCTVIWRLTAPEFSGRLM